MYELTQTITEVSGYKMKYYVRIKNMHPDIAHVF
jgi:hypothetical protein